MRPLSQIWSQNARLAGDYAASGTFDIAMQLLNQQIGVVNFEPLQPQFLQLAGSAWTATSGLATLPSLLNPIHRNFAYAAMALPSWNIQSNKDLRQRPLYSRVLIVIVC